MQQDQPINVPGAGPDFMSSIFQLPVDGVGVAPNQPKTTVYVAHVVGESTTRDQRRELFFASGVTPDVESLMQNDQIDVIGQWYEDLDKEYKVSWKLAPDDSWDVQ